MVKKHDLIFYYNGNGMQPDRNLWEPASKVAGTEDDVVCLRHLQRLASYKWMDSTPGNEETEHITRPLSLRRFLLMSPHLTWGVRPERASLWSSVSGKRCAKKRRRKTPSSKRVDMGSSSVVSSSDAGRNGAVPATCVTRAPMWPLAAGRQRPTPRGGRAVASAPLLWCRRSWLRMHLRPAGARSLSSLWPWPATNGDSLLAHILLGLEREWWLTKLRRPARVFKLLK